ncbi:hypothetical protein KI387_008338, partial [Taxus chinensis]
RIGSSICQKYFGRSYCKSLYKMSHVRSFQIEFEVLEEARGLVIGKGGRTIKKFQQSQDLFSKALPSGNFQIRGDSREAVERVVTTVTQLIDGIVVSKFSGHFPEFYRICFCKSVEKPLLAVDKVSFEKYTSEISFVTEHGTQYFCFKHGEAIRSGSASSSSSDGNNNLAAEFSSSFSAFSKVLPHWDFSAYRSDG